MTTELLKLLDRELSTCRAEIEAFPDDDLLWDAPEGISNTAGNLALHLAGNLQHFVGRVLGGTGYVRDREAEFGTRGISRSEVVRKVEETRTMLASVLPSVPSSVMDELYPALPGGLELSTRLFLMHLATHAAFHVGQIGYLRRTLTGENASVGGMSMRGLSEGGGKS